MENRIIQGDIVHVCLRNRYYNNVKVSHVPNVDMPQDCWHFEDEHGNILYIQRYDVIRKDNPKNNSGLPF
jgi:hypothetical protein